MQVLYNILLLKELEWVKWRRAFLKSCPPSCSLLYPPHSLSPLDKSHFSFQNHK